MEKRIEPTPEDYAAARRSLEEADLMTWLARHEARRRIERERRERRRARLRRLTFGLLGH